MLLDTPTFVVHRRVNRPLNEVQHGLADRTLLAPSRVIDLGADGYMYIDEPLRPVAPFSSRQPLPTWCARVHLLTARRRTVATVELEVSTWAHDATSVTIRPVARHPERWRAWRMRQYFALAHPGADAVARILARRATAAPGTLRDDEIARLDRRAISVGADG
jgi:hypothetical protein